LTIDFWPGCFFFVSANLILFSLLKVTTLFNAQVLGTFTSIFPSLSLFLDFDQLKICTQSKLKHIAAVTTHLILKSAFQPQHNTPLDNTAAKNLHVGLDDIVKDGKAPKLFGQKVPVTQLLWQPAAPVPLKKGDEEGKDDEEEEEGDDEVEEDGVDQGEAVDGHRDDEEGHDQEEHREPLVLVHLGKSTLSTR